MKQADAGLIALLEADSFVLADLYTITLAGGGTIRLTTADVDVTHGGNTYAAGRPPIDVNTATGSGVSGTTTAGQKATGHWKTGLDVDTWQVTVMPRAVDPLTGELFPDKIGNQGWLAAARAGLLDGAWVQVDRAYWAAWPDVWVNPLPASYVLAKHFVGRVSSPVIDRGSVVLNIVSPLDMLKQQSPRRLFGAGCRYTLYGPGCGLAKTDFQQAGTITGAGDAANQVVVSLPTPGGSGTYALGRLFVTGGANAGIVRFIRSVSGSTLTLMAPLPFPVAAGDAIVAYPGCDKTQASCTAFDNLVNFGGQPYIPAPETAV